MPARACPPIVRRIIGAVDESLILAIVVAKLLGGAMHAAPLARAHTVMRMTTISSDVAFTPMAPMAPIAPTAPLRPTVVERARSACDRAHTIDIDRSASGESRVTVRVNCVKSRATTVTVPNVVIVTSEARTAG